MVEYQISLIRNGSVNDIEARTSVMAADDVDALLKAKACSCRDFGRRMAAAKS